jgi:hypothetical protein
MSRVGFVDVGVLVSGVAVDPKIVYAFVLLKELVAVLHRSWVGGFDCGAIRGVQRGLAGCGSIECGLVFGLELPALAVPDFSYIEIITCPENVGVVSANIHEVS